MDKENGEGGGSNKHKSSSNSNNVNQPNIDVNDPSSLLNAASLFGKFGSVDPRPPENLSSNEKIHNIYASLIFLARSILGS